MKHKSTLIYETVFLRNKNLGAGIVVVEQAEGHFVGRAADALAE